MAQARPKVVEAERYPGVDIGAKINAADRALGTQPGEITVSSGGTFRTGAVISAGHTLRLKAGIFPSIVPGPTVLLDDNAALVADSWDVVLEETTAQTTTTGLSPVTGLSVFTIVQDKAGAKLNGSPSRGIRVEGVHFRGKRSDFNSALQTVSLGNCQDCRATRNWLENTRTIGLQIGGGSALGNFARNVVLNDNQFTGVASQNLAVTNAVGVEIKRNRFLNPGQVGGPGVTVIDVEPNTGDRIDDIVIEDNSVDATEAPVEHGGSGPKVTNAIAVNGGNPTTLFRNVRVLKNTIVGASHSQIVYNRISYSGILIRAASGVIVRDNVVKRVSRGILIDSGSTNNRIEANTLVSCGSGSTASLTIEDSSNNVITGNTLRDQPGDILGLGQRAKLIAVSGQSRGNSISNNGDAVF